MFEAAVHPPFPAIIDEQAQEIDVAVIQGLMRDVGLACGRIRGLLRQGLACAGSLGYSGDLAFPSQGFVTS